ncbi:hypothetical protein ACH5RR_039027 [Cinchona calisaya]|uniref:Transposase n=1 Tax=Cinchona calisaya TaxID=153742 RepID=A0ABD2XX17_9GENT
MILKEQYHREVKWPIPEVKNHWVKKPVFWENHYTDYEEIQCSLNPKDAKYAATNVDCICNDSIKKLNMIFENDQWMYCLSGKQSAISLGRDLSEFIDDDTRVGNGSMGQNANANANQQKDKYVPNDVGMYYFLDNLGYIWLCRMNIQMLSGKPIEWLVAVLRFSINMTRNICEHDRPRDTNCMQKHLICRVCLLSIALHLMLEHFVHVAQATEAQFRAIS